MVLSGYLAQSSALWSVLALALVATPLSGAAAREAIVEVGSQLGDSALSTEQAELAVGGVFIEPVVGTVIADRTADLSGRKIYSDRSAVAGSGTVVAFLDRPPRPVSNGAALGPAGSPLSRGVVTGRFGETRSQGGGGTHIHAGVDLAAPQGSAVMAVRDGVVSVASWAGSYGLLVVVRHADGQETRYAHLSAVGVAPGQAVRQGQVVGLVGSTGRSTGPHLHFEVRDRGRPVDPLAALR